ncbi:unnamed protein product [Chondrus crispus]|uniref:Uncharacterized protein n=1 Tax=Chondrus crispus TaxID=2769 RepID=R7QN98_CHOCR|nr:unnamed protein product [Chondrus crispus]CDF39263.1 unnamed protein product [Chondrus crispus]|eukprot:XP_005719174.1 unnamed protein product [Chondrus crispus]
MSRSDVLCHRRPPKRCTGGLYVRCAGPIRPYASQRTFEHRPLPSRIAPQPPPPPPLSGHAPEPPHAALTSAALLSRRHGAHVEPVRAPVLRAKRAAVPRLRNSARAAPLRRGAVRDGHVRHHARGADLLLAGADAVHARALRADAGRVPVVGVYVFARGRAGLPVVHGLSARGDVRRAVDASVRRVPAATVPAAGLNRDSQQRDVRAAHREEQAPDDPRAVVPRDVVGAVLAAGACAGRAGEKL